MVGFGGQTGGPANGTLDVDDLATGATDEVVVVVVDPGLVAGVRAGWLDTADQTDVSEHAKNVIDRLMGDSADICPHHIDHHLGVSVRVLL